VPALEGTVSETYEFLVSDSPLHFSVIAIMLGRLRMTIDDAIDDYENLTRLVFKFGSPGFHRFEILEHTIKTVVKQHTGDENAKMFDGGANACKACVALRKPLIILIFSLQLYYLCSDGTGPRQSSIAPHL
jgi:hypothetical protein